LRFSIPSAIVDFLFKVQDKMGMTHNGQGLAMWRHLKNVQPGTEAE
jgi:hypothetical protein